MPRVLVVDDEAGIRKVLAILLREKGHDVATAASGEEALQLAKAALFDLLILDVSLPGATGLDVLRELSNDGSLPTTIVMTAYGTIRSAVDAMRAGAFDYLTKPFDNDQLLIAVERAVAHRNLRAEVDSLRAELETRYGFQDMIGISPPMRDVFRVMTKVAASDATVLIFGESGTGKELVARGIHRRSPRGVGAFVAVNCSAIPATLVEAEFFGYERGAFTDAKEAREGKFEQAHRGTLFLDEVGDLPLEAQAKLLRVLQEHQVTRLGARKPTATDVRVLAATNKNLETAVARGEFREDLFWRLNVLSIRLPPLRDRHQDLGLLIDSLLQRLSTELGIGLASISPDARRLMLAHDWPGNVRELENTIRRALILADGMVLRAADLPPRIRGVVDDVTNGRQDASVMGHLTLNQAVERAVERIERAFIQAALAEHRGNRTLTAQSLGINRRTLFNKMRSYGFAEDGDEDGERPTD